MIQPFMPAWVKRHYITYNSVDEIPNETIERIRKGFENQRTDQPMVSIIVIAYNEEKTILKSLSSLSELKSRYPIEVIVSNNNSSDRTQEILDKCGVKSVFQPLQGVGFARDAGMQIAKGKYHLCADADSIYPASWVDEMVAPLEKGEAICTYGRVSFLPDGNKSRLSLSIYEVFKDIAIGMRSIKRPELVAGGASLAFFTRMGKQIGWRTDVKRGEDGQMVLAIKRFGYVKMVKSSDSRIWTTARTLDRDGNFLQMITKRLKRELSRLHFYFTTSKQNA
ncbi:MAG: glycosyltransferase family 2 protein [Bacteroidia bacterium]|nr:glycosyltransferase family 2 protein [Bacteroidia bacterium]